MITIERATDLGEYLRTVLEVIHKDNSGSLILYSDLDEFILSALDMIKLRQLSLKDTND